MGRAALLLSAVALAACGASNTPAAQAPSPAEPRHPFPQHVSYAPGTTRPSRRSQAQQDVDVRNAYEHWRAGFLVSAGSAADGRPLYRVTFGSSDPGRTVSEGQGFGMLPGLLPDFIVPVSRVDHTPRPAPPDFLEGPNDGDYYYNACRDPWRLGTDALLSGDPDSLTQARKLANWTRLAAGGNPSRIRPGYYLDGRPLSSDAYFTSTNPSPA